jgi:3-dehydroquinate synthase
MLIKSKIKDYRVHFTSEIKLLEDYFLVDRKVYYLYPRLFKNVNSQKIVFIDATEKNKSYLSCEKYITELINLGLKRGNTVGAIGGGIVQDITGFVSSIIYRGVNWNFYPTTLLAQCDSCIGGKTSINLGDFKNLVGNFNPPDKIIIDKKFLKTLENKDIQSGLGEIIKISVVDGKNRIKPEKINQCINETSIDDETILHALQIKKEVIEIDEFDKGYRNIMNFGHTFGHAIESMTNFKIPHGVAVGLGIDIANKVAIVSNYTTQDLDSSGVITTFKNKNASHYETFRNHFNIELFVKALKSDKKNKNKDEIRCILAKEKGNLNIVSFEESNIRKLFKKISIDTL